MTVPEGDPRVLQTARALRAAAVTRRHRRLLVLSGEHTWALTQAAMLLDGVSPRDVVWNGDRPPAGVTAVGSREAQGLLGTESGWLVVDAWSGLDPDALGALAGTLRAGGLMLLLAPPLDQWPEWPDPVNRRITVDGADPSRIAGRFLRRLARVLEEDSGVLVLRQGMEPPAPAEDPPVQREDPSTPPAFADDCLTADQAEAVAAVERVVTGHRRRPLVLAADRGRGKSAALGLAVARLQRRRPLRVLVTAPRQAATEAVFRHAGHHADLCYRTPRQLLDLQPPADLLLVDEAAGIPVAVLVRLLECYPRLVFASTVHGYEGTGRGFAVRFREQLDRLTPEWRELALETPVRWAPGDPLERVLFRALLMNAAPAPLPPEPDVGRITVERLDRDTLAADPARLEALFGLLVYAHYRTRPLDLRNLLDGPGLRVYAATLADTVVGAALVAAEGGFDPDTADAIWSGHRRPHGHLLPQSLATHVGLRDAARFRAARIMRIAAHPDLRRQGIGQALVGAARRDAVDRGEAILGTSFGATDDLLDFWGRCGLLPVRVGSRRDAASGTHSVLMAGALDADGEALVAEARRRFARALPAQLNDPLASLDAPVALAVLAGLPRSPEPDGEQWLDAASFACARREYAVCLQAIRRLVLWALTGGGQVDEDRATVLLQRVLQCRPWQQVAGDNGLAGRAGVVRLLRRTLAGLVRESGPQALRADPRLSEDKGG